jgi:hypothetical protein
MVAQLKTGRDFARIHFASKSLPRDVAVRQPVVTEQRYTSTTPLKTESSLAVQNSLPSSKGIVVGYKVETEHYGAANECPEQTVTRTIPVMEYPSIGNSNPEMGEFKESVTNWSGYTSHTRTLVRQILAETQDQAIADSKKAKQERIAGYSRLGELVGQALYTVEQALQQELEEDFDDFLDIDEEEEFNGSIADPVFLYN